MFNSLYQRVVLLLSTVLLLLSGCGFHLKGLGQTGEVVFKQLHIERFASLDRDMQNALQQQLALSGVQRVTQSGQAALTLQLSPLQVSSTSTAYSSLGETTAEIVRMVQAVKVIRASDGQVLLTANVQAYRDRQVSANAVLASNQELAQIRAEMAENLARQIIERVNRIAIKELDVKAAPAVEDASMETDAVEANGSTP